MEIIDLIRIDPKIGGYPVNLYMKSTEIDGKIVELDLKIFRKRV